MIAELVVRLDADEKIGRDQPRALVQQLVEGVLAVGAGLAPHHRRGLRVERRAVAIDALAVALHLELLQVRGQALQVLFVRQHRVRLRAEHARVPYAEQAEHDRHVLLDRRGAEVLVHLVGAVEHLLEMAVADGERNRQADRRPQRIAAADPVPEHEHVLRRRCRTAVTSRSLVEMATKCFAMAASSFARARNHSRADRALAMVSCVVNVFDAIVNSVVAGCSGRSVSARWAPSTFETKCVRGPVVRVRRQRLRHHGRAEIRSADADVDDVGDAQAGVAEPRAAANRFGERAHVIERGPHIGHHVAAVDRHRPRSSDCAARRA